MKLLLIGALSGIALIAATLVAVLLWTDASVGEGDVEIQPLTALASPVELARTLPPSWPEGLKMSRGGETSLLACLDANGDRALTAADGTELGDLVISLLEDPCGDATRSADYYVGTPSKSSDYNCASERRPALLVVIGSAGTDLLDPSAGESIGVLNTINDIQQRADAASIATLPILTTSSIFGADPPQGSLERLLAHETARWLDALPCLRAVLVGHSHGGATVTAVAAALDERYAARVFGVLIDRTTALYDRPETEFPSRIPLLNVFQTNQGWHGVPLPGANVYNIDQSYERAPIALSDGGGDLAPVGHKTLDDAAGVQRIIADAVLTWLTR
jgi:hypothetical protein